MIVSDRSFEVSRHQYRRTAKGFSYSNTVQLPSCLTVMPTTELILIKLSLNNFYHLNSHLSISQYLKTNISTQTEVILRTKYDTRRYRVQDVREKMKLYYRGLSYEYDSEEAAKRATRPFEPVRHQGCAYNLTYRGVTYRVDPNIEPREFDTPPAAYQLSYRGIVYCMERTHTGEVSTTYSQRVNSMGVAMKPKSRLMAHSCEQNKIRTFYNSSRAGFIQAMRAFFL